ncbi:hypothetical protein PF008_g3285 [Phytophthora fragariae]|uniref:Uncharacterized protein n=1 Tax=Phytophthora fragariae TaxID=53985 RepID=A0A6G0SFC0_9STRA|nr:hypothetical protein PF008_g3285 [Phytophthora fragariae]
MFYEPIIRSKITLEKTSSKVPFKFDEFYEAFGKSVSSDVVFVDGQVHIVQREKEAPVEQFGSKTPENSESVLPGINREGSLRKHAKGRLLDSADRRRLPWPIRALLEAQEPDGSWIYSSNFQFIMNDTAPPPMEGISGKMWATAVAITVWRQYPEYFELLETYYEKAMLHADENVLRIVRSVLQFDALDKVRPFKSDEARVIREQLAREAAAKRELELNEELQISRLREEEVRIGKLSLIHARRLPMPTQELFVAELSSEIATVFSALPPSLMQDQNWRGHSSFTVGQLVESCRRRRNNGSTLLTAKTSPRWHLCRISAVDEGTRLVQLDFLDGDCERERRVPMKFVRPTAAGAEEARTAQFEALKSSWSQPIVCEAEIARLEEARAVKLKPLPWDYRHHLTLQEATSTRDEDASHESAIDRSTSSRRPRSSTRRSTSRNSTREDLSHPVDTLFQAAALVLMQYDRAYARVRTAIESGARRYATAVLYRERFHAFDELAESLVTLVESTVNALEAIWRWKQVGSADAEPKIFVWKGDDFVVTLVRSLDFLGGYRELTEWYGKEFPLDGNPFMRSSSLLDQAEERGLQPAEQQRRRSSALRAALKLHKRSDDDPAVPSPTWWPEARYSEELLRRVEQTEQRLLADLLASRWLEKRRADQTVGR